MVLLHPINVQSDHGQKSFLGRNLWTGSAQLAGAHGSRPQNGRFGDAMGDILGYARVSTGDQDIAGQTVRLVAAGAIRIFSDVRSGRSIMDRPGLDALLAYARKGDTLAVVRLDRLGRSLSELLATVAALKERGIALFSLEENINTASAAGELVLHVFAVIAHFERRLIAERTKDGIIAARARGKHPGRHPLDPDKVAAAIQLVKAGLSPTVIARQLGLGRSTVYREIKRAGVHEKFYLSVV
jgi:DNA invertase Pin-like site-specific DNA recombinase